MIKAKIFLIDYFKKKIHLSDEDILSEDYLKNGLIDSLQFIMMINSIEKKFNISFSSSDLESNDIRTIDGLAGTINKLMV